MQLLAHFFRREFRSRYLGSMSGLLWAVVHPALQLLMYALVFEKIFKSRIIGAEAHGLVAYLGVGFWAWTLFAEASSRAATSVVESAALIGKVAVSPRMLVIASVSASAALHLVGYGAALILLALTGSAIDPVGVLLAIPVLAMLMLWTLGFGLLVAAIQVFIRDLAQVLAQLLAFWFFLTPVLYSRAMLPEFAQKLMDWNPLTYYPERLRELILDSAYAFGWADLTALMLALAMFAFGNFVFGRLRRHFEDFL
ncbi:MAG TPA: ABC transporter permease [Xanthomonadales bacterium]|nr:ABC transporter permease [Xanthomonadales bacterium]